MTYCCVMLLKEQICNDKQYVFRQTLESNAPLVSRTQSGHFAHPKQHMENYGNKRYTP